MLSPPRDASQERTLVVMALATALVILLSSELLHHLTESLLSFVSH